MGWEILLNKFTTLLGDRRGGTVIAEWYAEFTDTKRALGIKMTEVAIFTVEGDKFSALREYYKSEKTAL